MKWKLILIIFGITLLIAGGLIFMGKGENGLILLDKIRGNGIILAGSVETTTIDYTNNNMTIEFKEKSDLVGQVTLLSHKTYNETLEITSGENKTIIWYEFSNFTKPKENMLGEVKFIDMRYLIENESILRDGGFIDKNNLLILNPNYNKSYKKNYTWVYMTKEGNWLPYNFSNALPKDKIILGIQTNLAWGEFMDVQLSILGNILDKHALVEGTNCGFVTTAPTTDPAGSNFVFSANTNSGMCSKFTSLIDATTITEIGWYCDTATQEANFEVGIYTHDSVNNRAGDLIAGASQTNAKGTTAGWKKATGLDISISGNTIYWICVQLDATATTTNINYGAVGGMFEKKAMTSFPSTWGLSDESYNTYSLAIYAVSDGTDESTKPTITFESPTPDNSSTVSSSTQTIVANISEGTGLKTSSWIDFDRSLVGYWAMDYANSTVVYDNSSYGNNATYMASMTSSNVTTGIRGKGMNFSGSGSYLSVNTTSSLNLSKYTTYTMSAWIYPTSWGDGYERIFDMTSTTGTTEGYSMFIASNWWKTNSLFVMHYHGADNSYNASSNNNVISTGIWQQVTAVYNGTGILFYINGTFVNYYTLATMNPILSTDIFAMGRRADNMRFFSGNIDEAMIFNRSLNASEISALYDSQVNKFNASFAGLSEGQHNYTVYAIDSNGGENDSGLRNFIYSHIYYLNITNPTTVNFINVTAGNNYPIYFNYSMDDANITAGVSLDSVFIGGLNSSIVTNAGIYSKKTYSFTDYTNKTMFWTRAVGVFDAGGGTNASGTNYTNVAKIDGNYGKVCGASTSGNYELYERFNFTINEPTSTINWINITWKGNYSSNAEGANLYLFNDTDDTWINLTVIASGAMANYTVNYTTQYNIQNVVGTNKQLVVYARGENFDTGDCLYTDYVEVQVGSTTASTNQYAYVTGVGWNVNITAPAGLTGLQDLLVNGSYSGNLRTSTQSGAINYSSGGTPANCWSYDSASKMTSIPVGCNYKAGSL